MEDRKAILFVESTVFNLKAIIEYREDNGEAVSLSDKILPDSLSVVLALAKEQHKSNNVRSILEPKKEGNND